MSFSLTPARVPQRDQGSARLTVEVLEARTVPGFLAPVTSIGGGDRLTLAELNSDHFADAVVISGPKSVSVSLGNGDGTFRKPLKLGGAGGTLFGLSASDRNADGNLDIVAFGRGNDWHYLGGPGGYEGTVFTTVWLGNGAGSFGRPTTTSSVLSWWSIPDIHNPTSATGDFNGDGVLDKAGVGSNGLEVWLRNADGTYQPVQIYDAGPRPGSIAAGDVNGDGWTDLVVVNSLDSGNPMLSALLNDGNW